MSGPQVFASVTPQAHSFCHEFVISAKARQYRYFYSAKAHKIYVPLMGSLAKRLADTYLRAGLGARLVSSLAVSLVFGHSSAQPCRKMALISAR